MLRVVVDTNVAVSALLTPHGKAAKILNLITDEILKVCYSAEILAEYMDVLSRSRFDFSEKEQKGFINGIKRGVLAEPTVSDTVFKDESDRIFYDVAITCAAFLITGNIRHYPDEPFILTPAVFLELIET
jgi:putative PIN family toxin of toxin-antitoxin system